MTEHSLWRFSRALHRALSERRHEDLDALIDDDVDWAIYGPIDMFPFLGARRGKEAVLEVIRQIADNIRVHRFDRETIMLGVDSAASMLRYSLTALDFEQADQPADRPFRAIQGGPAVQHARSRRYLRSGGAGARASDPSAEARVGELISPATILRGCPRIVFVRDAGGYDFQNTIRSGRAADAGGRLRPGVGAAGRRAERACGRKSGKPAGGSDRP